MPGQTQGRNRSGSTPDPFGDPNAVGLVPPLPPKVPSKRDTGADATNPRKQDSHRAKPIRSQTQQNVGLVNHLCILRLDEYSWLLPSPTLATAVPKSLLPVAPYLKTLRQCHLSQKNPSRPSAQARRISPTQTLSIASIFQALVLVRPRFCLPKGPTPTPEPHD
jgi:hypothetical protein